MLYRPLRNTDPPKIVAIWNECIDSRGSYPLHMTGQFDRWVLSKPYFRNDDLLVAVDDEHDNEIVGFVLSGFGPNEERSALEPGGVVCCVMVMPSHRRRGIGRELMRRAEENLGSRGAVVVVVGSQRPYNPYLFGLYGGANSPGILDSEPCAEAFLNKVGYEKAEAHLVFQRSLEAPLDIVDGRFVALRRRYEIQMIRPTVSTSWWEECLWGILEPTEFRVVDRMTTAVVGRLVTWDLEGYSARWQKPAVGLFDVTIRAHVRQMGLAKFLIANVMKLLKDQFYAVVELQVWGDDPAGIGICKALGFEQVDVGHRYRKIEAQNSTT